METYDDIINEPYRKSTKHPHMSNYDRAAQFSPFAALTGYEDAVVESARLTDSRIELDEYEKEKLDEKLGKLVARLGEWKSDSSIEPVGVSITHFVADKKKSGGSYITSTGTVKKIDEFKKLIVMNDGTEIRLEDIIEIADDGAAEHVQ